MGAEASMTPGEEARPVPVTLHVYDLGKNPEVQAINSVLGAFGTGAFHCGVEVYGHEFSFNYKAEGSGVFKCPPRQCPGHTYRTSVNMGFTTFSSSQAERVLYVLMQQWPGACYHILNRNCCAFCDEFCTALGVGPIPQWTRNLAKTASQMGDAYDAVVGVPLSVGAAFVAVGDSISFGLGCIRQGSKSHHEPLPMY